MSLAMRSNWIVMNNVSLIDLKDENESVGSPRPLKRKRTQRRRQAK
jgi:hypothetical protein